MYKNVLFTHTDLDGAGCEIVFKLAHYHDFYPLCDCEGRSLVLHCTYRDIDCKVQEALDSGLMDPQVLGELVFADITPSFDTLRRLKDQGYNVMIFDHHVTALLTRDIIEGAVVVPEDERGVQQCGTSLMYQHYSEALQLQEFMWSLHESHDQPEALEELVDTIRSYDTYEWKTSGNQKAKELQTLFLMAGMESFVGHCMWELTESYEYPDIFDLPGRELAKRKIEQERKIVTSFTPDDIVTLDVGDYTAALVLNSKGVSISEIACEFLPKYPEYDFMVGFLMVGSGQGQLTFRSVRDDVDVSKIAALCGGGGHRKAAGAALPEWVCNVLTMSITEVLSKALGDRD